MSSTENRSKAQSGRSGLSGSRKSATPQPACELVRGADLVLLNGKNWTGESPKGARCSTSPEGFVQAVAMLHGRILAVGTDAQVRAYLGRETEVIDLGGRLAVPGFIDAHAHFLTGGFQLLRIDLKDACNEEEFVRRIADKAKTLRPGHWLLGGNWDEQAWPSNKSPTRWMVDSATPENPIFVGRNDGHAALANSLALKLARITRESRDPVGGVIVRDSNTGEATGVLKDAAMGLVQRVIPRPTEAETVEALKAALAEARRVGVTSVQNITMDAECWNGSFAGEVQLLRRAEREGWLTCRLYQIIPLAHWKRLVERGVSRGMGSEFLRLGAVKVFADGSLGSATAWMFEPFDDAENCGLPMALMNSPGKMEELVRSADAAEIQLCIHAIGDRAVAEVLDLYGRVGGKRSASRRFRMEHAQHVCPKDFKRFAQLGIVASMQPYHAIDDGRWAEKRIGRKRARSSYAWRSMLDAGVPLAFGSDWPVAPLSPLLGIYAAVTRAALDGKHPDGWFPEQRLSIKEALRAYAAGSAYAAFEEEEKGTISPGKLADVVVFSDDVFSIPPEKIRETRVILTVVGGKVVYRQM